MPMAPLFNPALMRSAHSDRKERWNLKLSRDLVNLAHLVTIRLHRVFQLADADGSAFQSCPDAIGALRSEGALEPETQPRSRKPCASRDHPPAPGISARRCRWLRFSILP